MSDYTQPHFDETGDATFSGKGIHPMTTQNTSQPTPQETMSNATLHGEDQPATERSKREVLLPCPFCGSSDVAISVGRKGDGTPWHYIECVGCSAMAESIELWNRRNPPDREAELNKPMPCGHAQKFADVDKEGTGFCVWCAWIADQAELATVRRELEEANKEREGALDERNIAQGNLDDVTGQRDALEKALFNVVVGLQRHEEAINDPVVQMAAAKELLRHAGRLK